MNEKNKDFKFLDAIYKNAEEQKAQLRRDIKEYKKEKKKSIKTTVDLTSQEAKATKFFDAINQDAKEHMAQISREIEEYKNEKIEQATEKGLQDAYDLIHEDVNRCTAAIVNSAAKKQLELRNELFTERQAIRDEVFSAAEERLRSFTRTDDYVGFLNSSLERIADIAGGDKCIVYIAPADDDKRELISSRLPGSEIIEDNHILIGGVKAHCPAQGIMLDDTLDTRLSDQYEWFYENSGLKVV